MKIFIVTPVHVNAHFFSPLKRIAWVFRKKFTPTFGSNYFLWVMGLDRRTLTLQTSSKYFLDVWPFKGPPSARSERFCETPPIFTFEQKTRCPLLWNSSLAFLGPYLVRILWAQIMGSLQLPLITCFQKHNPEPQKVQGVEQQVPKISVATKTSANTPKKTKTVLSRRCLEWQL